MQYKVELPKLGESILGAKIVQWFKKEGDFVKLDEPLLEVATDKVNSEIPSPIAGIITQLTAKVEEELEVGALLCIVETEGVQKEEKREEKHQEVECPLKAKEQKSNSFFSPAVLRLAQEKGIALSQLSSIPGTGEEGRITKKDIENYSAHTSLVGATQHKKVELEGEEERIAMTGMRKAIAENMVRSFYQAPHATLIKEVDVTRIMQFLEKNKESFLQRFGVKLTPTAFIAKAISEAVLSYPLINSSLEKETIVVKRYVNLGIAVSVDQGILVPVIKKCHTLSIPEIALQLSDLSKKARQAALSPKEVEGGTVTLTNFGISGIEMGIPIIRYPEVAILGVGAVCKKMVPLETDTFAIRSLFYLSLTFDHRVLDGMYGCAFLKEVGDNLENKVEEYTQF